MKALLVAKKVLRAIDPNDDRSAEPLSPLAILAVLIATGISAYFFLRWRIQPMQDLGLHASQVAVVADYGRADSIYPAIYKPVDWLSTNSLFCTVAGLMGRIIPPATAFKLTLSFYIVGIPLANLYALRVFGRSAWGALLAVPLSYNLSFVFGFCSFLFAGPLAVLAVPLFYRMLVRPTWRRVAAVTVCVTLLFLAHQHVFLWTGVLLFTMTVFALLIGTKRTLFGITETKPLMILWVAPLSVLPSLLLLARWYYRSTQPPATDEITLVTPQPATFAGFLESLKPASKSFELLPHDLDLTHNESDLLFFAALGIVLIVCVALARMASWKRPPVLELACALTVSSFFFLPEDFAGQQVIASRQLGLGLWFASAFFTPVPSRTSWLARSVSLGAIVWLTIYQLSYWGETLSKFERQEVAGFEQVMAAAPPKKILHYVNLEPESRYFTTRSFWHVESWYMLLKRGQCNENPAYSAMQPVRYRKSYNLVRPTSHTHSWSGDLSIWENHDLILIRRWRPTPRDLENANKYGERVAQHGDWDLWQSKIAKTPTAQAH